MPNVSGSSSLVICTDLPDPTVSETAPLLANISKHRWLHALLRQRTHTATPQGRSGTDGAGSWMAGNNKLCARPHPRPSPTLSFDSDRTWSNTSRPHCRQRTVPNRPVVLVTCQLPHCRGALGTGHRRPPRQLPSPPAGLPLPTSPPGTPPLGDTRFIGADVKGRDGGGSAALLWRRRRGRSSDLSVPVPRVGSICGS